MQQSSFSSRDLLASFRDGLRLGTAGLGGQDPASFQARVGSGCQKQHIQDDLNFPPFPFLSPSWACVFMTLSLLLLGAGRLL